MTQMIADEDGTMPPMVLLRAAEVYDGRPSMIAEARQLVRALFQEARERGVPVGARPDEDAQLVVSELITNAFRYAPGRCTLVLELDASILRIAVSDTRAQEPEPAPHDPQRVGGHGLEIVLKLCTRFETRPTESGKTITAYLPCT
jgi:anti-sigma regulatory factor (Ser/Thr protein kinase)